MASRSLHAVPNFDSTTDPRYPRGDKPSVTPSSLGIDLVAFQAASINLQNRRQNTAISINYRTYLTGTSAATATLSVNAATGTLGNWLTSGNNLTNTAANVGSGSLYVSADDGAGTVVSFPIQSWSIVAPSVGGIVQTNGIHYVVSQLSGNYSSVASALADYTTQCKIVANKNTSKIVKGFGFCGIYKLFMPANQGDWGNSQGITLCNQIFQMLDALPNQPPGGYACSFFCNAVGNAFNAGALSANAAKAFGASWWYDNPAYGPVSGNHHGGIYWSTTEGIDILFWTAPILNDIRQCWAAIYSAMEAQGRHIEKVDMFLEIAASTLHRNAGLNDTAFISVMQGTSGIPNGFCADMRTAMPRTKVSCMPTYAVSQDNMPTLLGILYANKWTCGNYDNTNEFAPADLVAGGFTAKSRAYWGDLAWRGQRSVGGAVVSTNFKALGGDFSCFIGADELGNRPTYTAAVPNANLGTGRIPDLLGHCTEMGASTVYVYGNGFSGPPCNTISAFTNQPANYKFPFTGSVVAQTNSVAYLAFLNAESFLDMNPKSGLA